MKKAPPLKIFIPEPCNQDWEKMPPQNDGRYCTQCTKVVHDFSQMTDTELLLFFKTKPLEFCGRFHRQQLNREIKPVVTKRSLPIFLKKVAAAVFATLSFRSATAQVQKTFPVPAITQTTSIGKNPVPETITINGQVTKRNNIPVANAKVAIDSIIEVYTDSEGKFSIQLSSDKVTTHNLYFSYEGLESAVRTFHPLMGSTEFIIRLMGKEDYSYSGMFNMGGPILSSIELPTIRFPNKQKHLTKDNKALLEVVAREIKINPFLQIQLVAYIRTANDDKKNAKRKIALIKDFFINQLNTDPASIKELISNNGATDVIDILEYTD